MSKVKVALIGVGNCASSLVQGVEYYKDSDRQSGFMYYEIGPYKISDIEFVAAFDVDDRKVGKDLSEAIFAEPNCTKVFAKVPLSGVSVSMGNLLDGVANHMKEIVQISNNKESDVVKVLKESKADVCICYLPVGSAEASRFYAQACIDAGVCFINAIPEFICSDENWIKKFEEANLICVGDDIKSQFGATILHRVLTKLIEDRGHKILNTYQLNIGGNTDFMNMKDESRIQSKRKSKTQAVTSILNQKDFGVKIGPSDYIPHLKDNKVCYINIKGTQFGDIPFDLDVKLSVEDSPNSAGVMTEVVRAVKYSKDRGFIGNVNEISAYAFKSPNVQIRDDVARVNFEIITNNKK